MGREVRRVPVGWEPPKIWVSRIRGQVEEYQPQHDETFAKAAREWMDECLAWENGTHPDAAEEKAEHPFYWQWAGDPPEPEFYRPDWAALGLDPSGYCLYETVSEGTPVTPVFATEEELIEYLVAKGDYWDQERRTGGWERDSAERMVKRGWAPSLIAEIQGGQMRIMEPRDMGGLE